MKKRLLLILLVFSIIFIGGCTAEISEIEEISKVVEETPIEDMPKAPEENISEELDAPVAEETVSEPVAEETMEEDTSEKPKCTRDFSPQFNAGQYYSGPLIDAHFHMPNLIDVSKIGTHGEGRSFDPITDPVLGKDVELDKILCNFDKEKVRGAIGFAIGAEQALDETLKIAKSIKEESSGKISLFLMPAMFSTESLENIEKSNKGLFKGYGEMAFYDPSYANTPPDSLKVMEIYEVGRKNNLIIMMHPAGRQESQVENALRKNPNVRFLLHGPEIEGSIVNLMNKYPNVYYSVDAVLARIPPMPAALMYTVSGKEEFLSKFPQNFDLMLNEAEKSWKAKIEQHPDRFMWGTDRGHKWTYDEEVSILLEEFGRAFIARLDPDVQEKFAYKNAERLLQE